MTDGLWWNQIATVKSPLYLHTFASLLSVKRKRFPPATTLVFMFLLELKVLDKLEQVSRPWGPQDPLKLCDNISKELVNPSLLLQLPFKSPLLGYKVHHQIDTSHRELTPMSFLWLCEEYKSTFQLNLLLYSRFWLPAVLKDKHWWNPRLLNRLSWQDYYSNRSKLYII